MKKKSVEVSKQQIEDEKFPMLPSLIQREQREDKELQRKINKNPDNYRTKQLEQAEVITKDKKICIPRSLQGRIAAWYHEYLGHNVWN